MMTSTVTLTSTVKSKVYHTGWDESFLQSLLDGGDGDVDSKVTFRRRLQMTKNKTHPTNE